jgi:exopolyphosphatase/pppGpp-phosphohydrolase
VEIVAARAHARALLADLPRQAVDEGIIVGGSGSALLRITPRAPGDDRLSRAQLDSALQDLVGRSAAESATAWALETDRTRVLPAGILSIEAIMERFGLTEVVVSRGSIREGVILEQLATAGSEGHRHGGG